MKVEPLSYGVRIKDISLANCSTSQLKDIIELCIKKNLIVLNNQKISAGRFNEINEIWGHHQPTGMWANHQDFPKIIRVTNKEVQKGRLGLFHGQELDWHCNGVFVSDPEECVSLWCIEPGSRGETYFACGVHAYNNLDKTIKEEIESAKVFLTNDIGKTYKKSTPYGTLLPHEQKDLDKMSTRTRHFAGGAEGNPYDKNISYVERSNDSHWSKKRKKDIEKPLVVKHPYSDLKGLYFPIYTVADIVGLKTPSRSKEIFNILCNNYVGSTGKVYRHTWHHGDLILSDQIHSLHRRDPYSGVRELYRTAFWYRN